MGRITANIYIEYKQLVPPQNVPQLSAALERLMGDENARKQLGARAPEVAERLSLERVMGTWEEVSRHEV